MVIWIYNNLPLVLEIVAVAFGLAYAVYAALNKVIAWPLGIIGSAISIFIFVVYAKLYAESILYIYYVVMGFYGWWNWKDSGQGKVQRIERKGMLTHLILVSIGVGFSFILYYSILYFTDDAERPLIDSFTTSFSFIATYMTTRRWIGNWIYWVVINIVSVYLYYSRSLSIYAVLMLINAIVSGVAYFKWKALMAYDNE
jgi:nicotinamide mononucleotide transporter